jgi:hypothetical protein
MPSDLASGPVFVVGMWRSGTSLLHTLLNQHPQIALMYEGELPVLWPLFLPGRHADWQAKWDLWNQALRRHGIAGRNISSGIRDLKTASLAVYVEYARKKGALIWGEKSPNYYDCLCRLARLFPNAKFILIWRSPVEICSSVIRAAESSPWLARPGTTHRALLGCERFKKECNRLLKLGAPVYQLQYEDLTLNTEDVMQRICKFLGIPFDARMTILADADRSAIYAGDHHAMVRGSAIVSSHERTDVLPRSLRKRIERYMQWWRREYQEDWHLVAHLPENRECGELSFLERVWCGALYRGLRTYDLLIKLGFCSTPITLWKAYRSLKGRN